MREHKWTVYDNTPCCWTCGVVRRADGKNRPCPGSPPRITVRIDANAHAAMFPPSLLVCADCAGSGFAQTETLPNAACPRCKDKP